MNRDQIESAINELNRMVLNGNALEAFTQVSVQRWQDGQIIHEQFFYNN